MKLHQWVITVLFLPLATKAQTGFGITKIINDKLCDTCMVPSIFDSEEPVSFMIAGAREEGEYKTPDPDAQKTRNGALPYVFDYAIAAGAFSLDFTPYLPVELWNAGLPVQKEYIEKHKSTLVKLQFSVLHNNRLVQDWTDIYTLGQNKEFQPGGTSTDENKPRFTAWKTYHAGKFQMQVQDSLIVSIRNNESSKIIYFISIKRVRFAPQVFDYVKFSSDVALQNIINNKVNRVSSSNIFHSDSIDNYEMDPDEVTVFRFPVDSRIRNNEVEYNLSNKPEKWITMSIAETENERSHIPGNYYLVVYKPTPGKVLEVLLRYKQQPESRHHINIQVKKRPVSSSWLKVLTTLGAATLLFSIWYAFKRRNYKKKLHRITLDKEELESKLQLLNGQLNPHFLFNSLNSIQGLINKNDVENASLYISEVSSFLRTTMSAGKKEYISLQEELAIEEAYIQLEQKRKVFAYRIVNHCNSILSQIEFPPSLLQPVIENTIHHGFSRNITEPLVTIGIDCKERQLIVSITDNGQGFDTSFMNPGQGLTIVQKRIALMNEKHNNMQVEMKLASTGSGTIVTFTFQNWL